MRNPIRQSKRSAARRVGAMALAAVGLTLIVLPNGAIAQGTAPAPATPAPATSAPATPAPAAAAAAPDKLVLYFDTGSSRVRSQDEAVLDTASRLYRDGKPIVMIVSGSTDSVGQPSANLRLSTERADAVVRGLVARGIPAERLQLLAKGATEPAVPLQQGVPQPEDRRVEISWR